MIPGRARLPEPAGGEALNLIPQIAHSMLDFERVLSHGRARVSGATYGIVRKERFFPRGAIRRRNRPKNLPRWLRASSDQSKLRPYDLLIGHELDSCHSLTVLPLVGFGQFHFRSFHVIVQLVRFVPFIDDDPPQSRQ